MRGLTLAFVLYRSHRLKRTFSELKSKSEQTAISVSLPTTEVGSLVAKNENNAWMQLVHQLALLKIPSPLCACFIENFFRVTSAFRVYNRALKIRN